MENKEMILFKTKDGHTIIDVNLTENTVWLNQKQMADLFDRDYKTVSKHINNIFKEGELDKSSTVAKFETAQIEGEREIKRDIEHYNLDVFCILNTHQKRCILTDVLRAIPLQMDKETYQVRNT